MNMSQGYTIIWKAKPPFVFSYLLKHGRCCLCKSKVGSPFRQLLLWGWENQKSGLCRNLAGSSCRGSEVSAGKSHLQEIAKFNAFANVKSAGRLSALGLKNWWNLIEQEESCSLRFGQTGYPYPTGHPPCISEMLWFRTCRIGEKEGKNLKTCNQLYYVHLETTTHPSMNIFLKLNISWDFETVSLLLLCQVVHHESGWLPNNEWFLFSGTKNCADHWPTTWSRPNVS